MTYCCSKIFNETERLPISKRPQSRVPVVVDACLRKDQSHACVRRPGAWVPAPMAAIAAIAAIASAAPGAGAAVVAPFVGQLEIVPSPWAPARPNAVSIDPVRGEICVTDEGASALHVFNAQGARLFVTSGVAGLASPASGLIDGQGRFVCTDTDSSTGRTLRRLSFLGEPEPYRAQAPASAWRPLHLCLLPDGDYLSLDPEAGLLACHDADSGALRWQRAVAGPRADELHWGRPAAAPDGRLYIPGGETHQVIVLAPDGQELERFGSLGTAPGRFVHPVGVAFLPAGRIAVLDRMRHTVLVFDAEHRFVTEFGGYGGAPGRLYHPVAIAATSEGTVYVAQGYQARVQAFRVLDPDADAAGRPSPGEHWASTAVSHPTSPAKGATPAD